MPHLAPHLILALAALGSGLLITASAVLAYRIGRDRGMRLRAARFDRLFVEVNFHDTTWTMWESTSPESRRQLGHMKLHQCGARLLVAGVDANQRHWSAEGVVFRRGAHLLFVERLERGHAVGTLHLHLDDLGQSMTGFMSIWESQGTGGMIRSVTFERVTAADTDICHAGVDVSPHTAATVANRQHLSSMS